MTDDFLDLCDTIDAAVFSGDTLDDEEICKEFNNYLGRWQRESERKTMTNIKDFCTSCDSTKCQCIKLDLDESIPTEEEVCRDPYNEGD